MVDIGIFGLFFLAIFYGYRKGFVGQAVGIISIVLSVFIAYSYSGDVAVFLQQQIPLSKDSSPSLFQTILDMISAHQIVYRVVVFFVIFLCVQFLCRLIGRFMQSLANLPVISIVNRLLGALLGSIKVFFIVWIAIQFTLFMPNDWKIHIDRSVISQYMLQKYPPLLERLERKIPDFSRSERI